LYIDRNKLIKWECLSRYFQEKRGMILDAIFQNPNSSDTTRREILNKLEISDHQKNFLIKVFDIDYIFINKDKPVLIEEKMKNIKGKKFQSGNYVYLHHGTRTQHKNLKDAQDIGIESGILLRCVKFEKAPEGLLGYALADSKNMNFDESKFYPIKECEYLPQTNQTRIRVDDFIKRMRVS